MMISHGFISFGVRISWLLEIARVAWSNLGIVFGHRVEETTMIIPAEF